MRWKLVGLAGLTGVAATGVVLARKRRVHHEYHPDELREQLHRRLAEVSAHRTHPAGRPIDPVAPPKEEGLT